jgi:hypothetical protein
VRPTWLLYDFDASGIVHDSIGTVPGDEIATVRGVIMRPRFVHRTRLLAARDRYYATTSDSFHVTSRAGRAAATTAAHRAIPLRAVSDEDLRYAEGAPAARGATRPSYPAIDQLLLDADGLLWASPYDPAVLAPRTWYVFQRDGQLVDSVSVPERVRPFHIGTDFLLGVWYDPLDVEYVRLYRLRRSGAR